MLVDTNHKLQRLFCSTAGNESWSKSYFVRTDNTAIQAILLRKNAAFVVFYTFLLTFPISPNYSFLDIARSL